MKMIGIDTGVNGGMCLLQDGEIIEVCAVPNYWEKMKTKTPSGNVKRRRRINYMMFADVIHRWAHPNGNDCDFIIIEKVTAMPKNGAVSMFSFGEAWGAIQAAAAMAGLKTAFVRPMDWKKHFDLLGTDKADSIRLAREIYGKKYFPLAADHNMAESALIARYGQETFKKTFAHYGGEKLQDGTLSQN